MPNVIAVTTADDDPERLEGLPLEQIFNRIQSHR
jgi:hypothetical protein